MAKYKWAVRTATLAAPQPDCEPAQLELVLDNLANSNLGWEIMAIVPDPAHGSQVFNRVRVVSRRRIGVLERLGLWP